MFKASAGFLIAGLARSIIVTQIYPTCSACSFSTTLSEIKLSRNIAPARA